MLGDTLATNSGGLACCYLGYGVNLQIEFYNQAGMQWDQIAEWDIEPEPEIHTKPKIVRTQGQIKSETSQSYCTKLKKK